MFTIRLSDGSQLEGLTLNGNNFISNNEITEATFAGKLGHVVISGDADKDEAGLIGEHEHMQLVQIVKYEGKWWFVLRELSAAELEMAKMKSDIAYTAMMSGVDLDE